MQGPGVAGVPSRQGPCRAPAPLLPPGVTGCSTGIFCFIAGSLPRLGGGSVLGLWELRGHMPSPYFGSSVLICCEQVAITHDIQRTR